MTFLRLKWRIQIIMTVMCLGPVAFVVHGRDSLPVPINETSIGMMVGGAFLISIILGIAWHWHSMHAEH